MRSFEPCVVRTAYLRRVSFGVRWFLLSKAGVSPDPERKRRTVLVRWALGSKTQLQVFFFLKRRKHIRRSVNSTVYYLPSALLTPGSSASVEVSS